MLIAPLLPMILLLAMAVLLGLLPWRRLPDPFVRALTALACLSGALALIVSVALRLTAGSVSLASPSPLSGRALSFSWDGLGTLFGLFLALGMGLQVAIRRSEPLPRYRAVGTCVLVSSGLAGCAAADLVTLCYSWGVMDLTAIVLGLLSATEDQAPLVRRRAWTNGTAMVLVIVALLLVAYDQGRTSWSYLALQSTAFILVTLAAWLRLGAYPLPSAFGFRWREALIPITTGGLLWMRVGSVAPFTPGNMALETLATVGLVMAAVLAVMAPDREQAMPGLILHGLSMAVLAPMLDTIAGFAVSLMTLANLAICLTVIAVEHERPALPPLGRWDRLPDGVAWAALAGCPLTLGFASHWLFLRVCWLAGAGMIYVMGTITFLLLAILCWRERPKFLRDQASTHEAVPWHRWLPFAGAALPALGLVLTGLNPAWLERIWQGGYAGFDLPSLEALFAGHRGSTLLLFISTVIVPFGSIFVQQRFHLGWADKLSLLGTRLGMILRLEWFYMGIEDGLLVIQRLFRRIINSSEESFFMVWMLVCAASMLLFLIKR